MTHVRYTADGGHYRIGGYGFDPGDEKDVDDDVAGHLEDVDVFEVADDLPAAEDLTVDDVEEIGDDVIEQRIDAGECPWCDEYEGDAVGQHAASAHSDAWDDFKGA